MKKFKEIGLVLLFQVVNLGISVFFIPYFLSKFSTDQYGLIILISQITGFILFLDLGVSGFLTQKIASKLIKGEDNKRLISSSIGLLLLIGLFLLPFIAVLIFYLETIFKISYEISLFTKLLIFISLSVTLINLFLKPYNSLLYSEEKLISLTLLSNSTFIIYNILCVLFVYMNFGINSFFYSTIISNIVYLFVIVLYFKKNDQAHLLKVSMPHKREIVYFISGGFFLFVNGIAAQIIYNGDRILVAKYVSISALTLFTVNIRIIEIVQAVLFKISDFFIPKIIKVVSYSIEKAIEYYVSFTKLSVIIVSVFQVNFLLFNNSIISLWVGNDLIIEDYNIIFYYLLVCFSNIIFRIPSLFLYAAGKNMQYSIFSILDAVLNILFSIILVKIYGIKGIVIASIISTCLTSVPSNLYLFKKHFSVKNYFSVFLKPIFFPIIILSPFYILSYFLRENIYGYATGWFSLALTILVFNILYIPTLLLIFYGKPLNLINELKKINNGVYGRENAS